MITKERFVSIIAVSVASLSSSLAVGDGSIQFNSTSYLRTSPDRVTNAGSIHLDYQTTREGRWFTTKGKFSLDAYAGDLKSTTPEMSDLYISTSRNLSPIHQVALGRMVHEWSVADSEWAIGDWSPRFNWDPLKPETVGLTGFHYQYRSKYFSIRAFASPFNIPERGAPIRTENGRIVSSNPDAAIQYEAVSVMNAQVPIYYTINMPPMKDLLFHSSKAIQFRVGDQVNGPWAAFAAGSKPMNAPDITASAALKLSPTERVDAQLYPRIISHDLMTVEAGVKNSSWNLWASMTRETPHLTTLPAGRSAAPIGPAVLSSAGFDVRVTSKMLLKASILSIRENPTPVDESSVKISLPSRYRFKQAAQAGLQWQAHSRLRYSTALLNDFAGAGRWISAQGEYQFHKSRWMLGLSADLFNRAPRDSFLGPYAGNDRVEGRLTYAF